MNLWKKKRMQTKTKPGRRSRKVSGRGLEKKSINTRNGQLSGQQSTNEVSEFHLTS